MFRSTALALTLATPLAAPLHAQQFGMGIDQNLVMMMEQMISSTWMTCQMGDQMSCQNAQSMQYYAQEIIGAGQYCMQTGDMYACNYYQQGAMNVQMAYMQMAQQYGGNLGGATGANPLGSTHEERMANIAAFGAQNTANWQNQQAQNDAAHNAFLDTIRQ